MIKFWERYWILIVAGVLATTAFTLIGIQAVMIYRISGDVGYIYIWLGGVILMVLGLYHPVKMLIKMNKGYNEG